MKRRSLIAGGSVALLGGLAGPVLGVGPLATEEEPKPEYRKDLQVVYDHDELELSLSAQSVQIGESIEVEIRNTADDEVGVGCKIPWALQRRSNGEWQHVTWTEGKFYLLCLSVISAGDSTVVEIPLSETELEERAAELQTELRPGEYRFVLIGAHPSPAVNFNVESQ